MVLPVRPTNHMAPSGPDAMPDGVTPALGSAVVVMTPLDVIRPIAFPASWVNHTSPPGPAAMPLGTALDNGRGN